MPKWLIFLLVFITFMGLLLAFRPVIYQINPNRCTNCGRCYMACPNGAISFSTITYHYYIDPNLCNGCGTCVSQCTRNAIYQVTAADDEHATLVPNVLSCYPNPLREYTDFHINLPVKSAAAMLRIFNNKGQTVDTIELTKTSSILRWQAKDKSGKRLPSGIYIASVKDGDKTHSIKLSLVQ